MKYGLIEVVAKKDIYTYALIDYNVFAFEAKHPFIPIQLRAVGFSEAAKIGSGTPILLYDLPIGQIQDYFPISDPVIPQTGLVQVFEGEIPIINANPSIDITRRLAPPGLYYFIEENYYPDHVANYNVLILEEIQ